MLNPKFCSFKCYNQARTTKNNIKQLRKCNRCNKEYLPTNWYQKYCSGKCRYQLPKPKKCSFCGKEYLTPRSVSKYCSRECHSLGYKKNKGTKKRGKKISGNKKSLIGTLDTLWAKIIKARANNKCEYCGKSEHLNAHHLFSRSNNSLRWDLDNGICLCVTHHVFGIFSAHKAPLEFAEWVKETRGIEWYENLRKKAKEIKQVDELWLEEMIKEYKEKLKQLS